MQAEKKDVKSMLPDELASWLTENGEAAYRAGQIFKWLSRSAESFNEMTDLNAALRAKLEESFYITVPRAERKQVSRQDGTVKYLWRLRDGNAVESVVMSYGYGNTVCISSQAGCRMGCVFCASAGAGYVRDLEPSEMLDQVLFSEKDSARQISNVVMMDIGEPLDNFDNVMRFLSLINHPGGRNMSLRHVSLSTCGLVDGIDRLAEKDLQLTLSISLHAPDDETRRRLMPAAARYGVAELLDACGRYFDKTGRRISFEYALIKDVNDSEEQAKLLASLMKRVHGHVNIIPLNKTEGSPLIPGDTAAFAARLKKAGVNATVRRRLGADIDAACGQLRRKGVSELCGTGKKAIGAR
ncbi:MAG: 23S rRNA (adenine(2503)-C(2))-methyltransferase RlmN [Oscillospiraceae bacterium]|nr:23S rRNA (adenine(2503)-C(2))-methyltransferase RlmN [Oscillospiraceae bacterium]